MYQFISTCVRSLAKNIWHIMCINLAKYLFRDILLDSRQIKESNIESGELELGRRGEKVIFHFFLFKIVSQ